MKTMRQLLSNITDQLKRYGYIKPYQSNAIIQFINAEEYEDAIDRIIQAVKDKDVIIGGSVEQVLTPIQKNDIILSNDLISQIYFDIDNIIDHCY